ncbi:XRN 5'-3' exonuclease [Catovirus CTV1]|uniref:XRN 5'-3' exonuclease n=1 Tax=Catovirus CTV1 TaxID=1977631 RepID=A0A1V0SC63_9VIRU|nr:XRN 5'-3' exonuclease [Catovirus CTV1]
MGVPGFFSWLIKQYKEDKLITDNLPEKAGILYIDANCLFHPQCFKVLEGLPNETNIDNLESKMIQRILNYIDFLIGYVDPQKMVYIAVDGVAPLAKINQQRKRRYRSIDDNNLKNSIKSKYGIKSNNIWSNVCITPGTEFMEKLHNKLSDHFNKNKRIKIIYSSYHSSGEGEHKILQHIKNLPNQLKKCVNVIYGLDADLFFLSMASQLDNIYLLRENSQLGGRDKGIADLYDIVDDVAEELKFVSIDTTKNCYNEQIKNILETKLEQIDYDRPEINTNINFCNDFTFMCYLLGNDFLPHFPSIDIKKNGLDIILNCYTDIYINCGENLIQVDKNDVKINNQFFVELIKKISNYEKYFFTKILPEINSRKQHRRCPLSDKYSREIWEMENMKNIEIDDPIKLGEGEEEDWKFRYYEHYFHTIEYQKETIKDVCESYTKGLKWVTEYYFKECSDWKWQYDYNHAPFISDLYNYIKANRNINNITFKANEPINCLTQLMCVLPPSCCNMLPQEFRNLVTSSESPVIDMFPTKIELDMINKDLYWQCVPMIPALNIDRILLATKNIKFSGEYNIRNKKTKEYMYN